MLEDAKGVSIYNNYTKTNPRYAFVSFLLVLKTNYNKVDMNLVKRLLVEKESIKSFIKVCKSDTNYNLLQLCPFFSFFYYYLK